MAESSINAHLAEYNALRAEILARIQAQGQAFQLLVTILGALVALIAYLLKDENTHLFPQIALFIPIVIAPLAYIFFDNEIMIFRNGFYICNHLRQKFYEQTGDHVFQLEEKAFLYVNRLAVRMQRVLSIARLTLFVLPVLGPLVYALLCINQWTPTFVTIAVIDSILSLLVLAGIYTVLNVHNQWGRLNQKAKS